MPVNKGACPAERNTSFNHRVILLTTLYENADHAGVNISIHTKAVKVTERKQSLTELVACLWLLFCLAIIPHPCMHSV